MYISFVIYVAKIRKREITLEIIEFQREKYK